MPDLRTPSPTLVSAARDKAWPDLQRFLSNDDFGNVDGVDGQGRTALLYAAGYGDLAAVRALCEAGADVNAGDRAGMTPLHWACLKAHAPVVELLLGSKADAFVRATAGIFKGRCALDLADHAQSDAVREVLLTQLGASMFELRKVLGRGGYGCVIKAVRKDTGGTVALKAIRKAPSAGAAMVGHGSAQLSAALTERAVLSEIEHPFIVRLHSAFQTKNHLYLVLDFCAGGDLSLHVRHAPDGRLAEPAARFVAAEVLLALEHLHEHGVLHRDIKARRPPVPPPPPTLVATVRN